MSKHRLVTIAWLLVCFVLVIVSDRPWMWLAVASFAYLALISLGAYQIELNYFLHNTNKGPNARGKVAITFDDGPDPNTLPVLEVLERYGAKATFFCIGSQIEKHPEILRKIHERGHLIGNHTFSHSYTFPVFTVKKMEEEIIKTNGLIKKWTGEEGFYFRPPFGVTNPRIAKAIRLTGMRSIGWNRRSLDTVKQNQKEVLERTAHQLKSGDILLFHDRLPSAAATLEAFFKQVEGKGFLFERVDQLLKRS